MNERAREAFEGFCRSEYGSLVRLAYLLTRDSEESKDVAQEALARAYERWGRVSSMDYPDLWVRRVATNLALSWIRRSRRTLIQFAKESKVDEPAPQDSDLTTALNRLSPSQRKVVVLRYCLDQSIEQVATILQVKPGTVRALGSQGLRRLREMLKQEGVKT